MEKKKQTYIIYLKLNITSQIFLINLTLSLQFFIFKILPDINTNIIEVEFFLIKSYIVIFKKIVINYFILSC